MTITVPEYRILDGAFTDELVQGQIMSHVHGHPLWGATYVNKEFPVILFGRGNCIETHPEAVRAVHSEYIRAGSDIILTSGYQAHPDNLKRHLGYDQQASSRLLQMSVQLALDAAVSNQAVAISMGSYGATLCDGSEYTGSFASCKTMLTDFHLRRLKAYGDEALSGATYLAFETIPCVVEVEAVIAAMDLFFTARHRPRTWISVTCRNSRELGSGDLITDVARLVYESGYMLGINCTAPQYITGLLAAIRLEINDASMEIVVYPNKGQKWNAVSREWSADTGMTDDEYAAMAVMEWVVPFSPLILGGCCQTGPGTISALYRIRTFGLS